MAEKVEITKKDLRKAWNRYWWVAETGSSFDRRQAVGFCYACPVASRSCTPTRSSAPRR